MICMMKVNFLIGASIVVQSFYVSVTVNTAELQFSVQLQQRFLEGYFKRLVEKNYSSRDCTDTFLILNLSPLVTVLLHLKKTQRTFSSLRHHVDEMTYTQ